MLLLDIAGSSYNVGARARPYACTAVATAVDLVDTCILQLYLANHAGLSIVWDDARACPVEFEAKPMELTGISIIQPCELVELRLSTEQMNTYCIMYYYHVLVQLVLVLIHVELLSMYRYV